ncbi:uncharacterized protein V2V93DRAFT_311105, partial [Kockiozyma suomiensis]|uniref:uncharacterized protein n=1 Tax=Kockiozyma suomiensis TaxID=1337062 RepID=UPI003342EF52
DCVDPYKMPGYLYQPKDYKLSLYVPFYDEEINKLDDPATAVHLGSASVVSINDEPDFISNDKPDVSIVKTAPHSWMMDMTVHANLLRKQINTPGDMTEDDTSKLNTLTWRLQWLKHKRILLCADSVDRYMIQYFCEELGLLMKKGSQRHTTSFCHVPYLNFTMYHWHLASYVSYRSTWWWQPQMKYITFEDRYKHIFEPTLSDVRGLDGQAPDLVMYQSGLWDQVNFSKMRKMHDKNIDLDGAVARAMTWPELRYYMARQRQFVAQLRQIFGEDAHLMYRSLTVHREEGTQDLMLYDMDRVSRSLAHSLGIEVFDWSRIVTGHTPVFNDRVHVKKGVMSWLYMNTLLSYAFREAGGLESHGLLIRFPKFYNRTESGDPWLECHDYALA